jgi:membrane-associated protein
VRYHGGVPTVQGLVDWLTKATIVTGPWAPAVLFGGAFVEHVFPPFPGDLVVVLGAWYAVHGGLSWPALLASATAGAVCGAWLDHAIGAALGRRLERSLGRSSDRPSGLSRLLSASQLAAFEVAYRRWGLWLILLNRFMPGIRAFLFVAAGTSGLPLGRVLLLGALSALAWNGLLLLAGGLLAGNAQELVALVDRYMVLAGAVLAVAALLLAGRALWRRRRGSTP